MRTIFRQKALEQLSSPEQLDQLMQVTTLRGWLMLIGLILLVAMALFWGFFGTIPTSINGEGVLISSGGIRNVPAPDAGQIANVAVQIGDIVTQGQILAVLRQRGPNPAAPPIETPVISPIEGRVLDITVSPDTQVERGSTLAVIEPNNEQLKAVIYLPFADGKAVRAGMLAQIAPSTVQPETYGVLLGQVISVASFPSTRTSMMRTLGNETLVQSFLEQGAQIEVQVDLATTTDTVSGYHWSTPDGPPFEITSGTPCEASFIVSEQAPINLVFPGMNTLNADQ